MRADSEISTLVCEAPDSPLTPHRAAQFALNIYSQIDALMAAALIFAALGPLVRFHPPLISGMDIVDDSWQLDMAFKAMHHVWMGRDQAFTYGALYQGIVAFLPFLRGFSVGAVYSSYLPVQFCIGVLLIYTMGLLLLRRQPPWRRAFYLLLLAIFWWPGNSKSVLSVAAFVMITVLVQGLCDSLAGFVWRAGTASSIIIVSFLFSADCGEYSLAALAIAVMMGFFCNLRKPFKLKDLAFFSAVTGVFLCVAALALNFILFSSAFNFTFWRTALELADSYRWGMALGMPARAQTWFVATTGLCILVFIVAWLWRDPHSQHLIQRPLFLQGAFLFSLLSLQTAVIRSDWEHVSLGLFPMISLSAAILVGSSNRSAGWVRSYLPVYSLLILTAIFSGPLPFLGAPAFLTSQNRNRLSDSFPCPAEMNLLDQACFKRDDFRKLSAVSSSLQGRIAASESLTVFPYENIYAVLARRRAVGGLLQHYIATTDYLSDRQLAGLTKDLPPLLIYSMDGLAASRIDGVSSFTRTPKVWFYFQEHYAEEAEPYPGILFLRRDNSRALNWHTATVGLIGSQQIGHLTEGLPIGLGPLPPWPDHGQFLKLDLTVRYPFWWRVLKPCRLTVDVELADGTHKLTVALAEPNKATEVWVYPGDENQLRSYFSETPRDWRAAAPPIPVSRIRLWLDPLDWLSVKPTGVAIHGVQVVQILG